MLPMPASFVVDPAGAVRYAHVDPDYRYRPEPSDYLPILGELVGTSSSE
jgi:peroxiredoxin